MGLTHYEITIEGQKIILITKDGEIIGYQIPHDKKSLIRMNTLLQTKETE